ncbi:monovalent cation/H+ antiporter complex subunit F [Corynebacterium mendelii]|uniref:Cation:proton antiporter n=1 Tax=Corynebacterium mendelii TaxID=2765362 RepID=A0A939E1I7_9CORY|nr:monovalent cation/H+ antiporter complex subunit F [Corynebacterium mendelii]MBN9643757.1 cation:proton antiporter [Corynebacterium mendelii]
MSAFDIVCYTVMAIMGLALIMALVLIIATKNDTSKAVLADAVFYPMVGIYVVWTMMHPSSITYEVVLLAGLLGLLSSVSMARILSKGRR